LDGDRYANYIKLKRESEYRHVLPGKNARRTRPSVDS
jgi:hypothetical protein